MRAPGPWCQKCGERKFTHNEGGEILVCDYCCQYSKTTALDGQTMLEERDEQIRCLTAENARLREALAECVTDDGAVCFEHREYLARRVSTVSDIARAALAGGEK